MFEITAEKCKIKKKSEYSNKNVKGNFEYLAFENFVILHFKKNFFL